MEARTSQRLEMHPTDAKARGIADGDKVRVWNDRGEITLTALVRWQRCRKAWLRGGWTGPSSMTGERPVNALTSERLTDIGAGATFYSVLVEVAKA